MVGKRKFRAKVQLENSTTKSDIPDVYREMLAEALPSQDDSSSKPLKRRKTKQSLSSDRTEYTRDLDREKIKPDPNFSNSRRKVDKSLIDINKNMNEVDVKNHNDQGFDDVFIHKNKSGSLKSVEKKPNLIPAITQQTTYRDIDEDSDEDSEESYCDWEDVGLDVDNEITGDTFPSSSSTKDLELTLSKTLSSKGKSIKHKRRSITKKDRLLRLAVHKMHILCLLSSVDLRNDWCNDVEVQASLRPYITPSILKLLRPKSELSQFSLTQSLKKGLAELSFLWKTKFRITERGMRRALWIDDENNLQYLRVSDNADSILDRIGFYKAAAAPILQGSRDLGAQLFCALLRSVGLETRLICSLQPLPFKAGGPFRTYTMTSSPAEKTTVHNLNMDAKKPPSLSLVKSESDSVGSITFLNPRSRLGHPNAADYHIPKISNPLPVPAPNKVIREKPIRESPFPVFWVEVFDEAHQKWIPVDPLVTQTISKSRVFEPPASDGENNMSYVIAFDKEGYARDVTRRYVKAYNGKTRKIRVESTSGGEKWWTRVMRSFSRMYYNDADQIENVELAVLESQEPMPRNVADFKGHSYFVLKRHLHRNEVLVRAKECGRIATGRGDTMGAGKGQKKIEIVFRRQDVQVAKSANSWYRLGRMIKLGEQPVKTIIPSKRKIEGRRNLGEEKRPACSEINLYLEEQTEIYVAPPVVNGLVPKNSFGNIDLFVPEMLPRGAAYIPEDQASEAAKLLGIDYAHALTGFDFHGRHGTAILKGIVVAEEYNDAVRAVIEGLNQDLIEAQEQARSQISLRMWKRFIIALRIKQRIDSYQINDEILNEEVDSHHHQEDLHQNIIDNSDSDSDEYVVGGL
ncbi:DNA repair protein rhp41 [Erysiphe neolycopersici]|uniref:DNA repair protein rhp41 n=1 Tax=Erysiphe neolycopersici TaxID=212602 RepID=A0A420HSV9_9PEZI|nr:DNA repair protein rhp41 [Erysiphe neolycopersici]